MKTQNKVSKIEALMAFLEVKENELEQHDERFEYGSHEYLVLTDSEADNEAKEYILDSAWAFNKSFLDAHSEAISELDEKSFKIIQDRCESANKAILAMITDKEHFVKDAIACDGRGHFLSSYDGEEAEQDGYFIYRTN